MENRGSSTLVYSLSKSGIDVEQIRGDLEKGPEENRVLFRKCRCGSSWCPACGLPGIRDRMFEIYKEWPWPYVRTYALTVDRSLYRDGKEAYFEIQRKKELAEFMRRLKNRLMVHGITIYDYVWILEWHDDGFPHWHFLVRVNKKGKQGQIASKVDLTETWGRARFVKEGYIRNQRHWAYLVGYVAKRGYFGDGKKKQAELPQWAKDLPKTGAGRIRIKRMERMRGDKRDGKTGPGKGDGPITKKQLETMMEVYNGAVYRGDGEDSEEYKPEKIETWGENLARCGAKCLMTVSTKFFFITILVPLSYSQAKEMGGEYKEGLGLSCSLGNERILDLLRKGEKLLYYNRVEFDEWGEGEPVQKQKEKPMKQMWLNLRDRIYAYTANPMGIVPQP